MHQMGFFPVLFHDYLFTKFHANHCLVALKKDTHNQSFLNLK